MTENFIREFDALGSENIMGIYGGAHTGLDAMDYTTNSVPCMANQLKERYGTAVHSEDLIWISKDIEAIKIDRVTVDGKEYGASYYGKEEIGWHDDFVSREFWRLEDACDDFKGKSKTEMYFPITIIPCSWKPDRYLL